MIVRLEASGLAFTGTYKAAVHSVGPTDSFAESAQVASGAVSATHVVPD